jgi:hypothetical protein
MGDRSCSYEILTPIEEWSVLQAVDAIENILKTTSLAGAFPARVSVEFWAWSSSPQPFCLEPPPGGSGSTITSAVHPSKYVAFPVMQDAGSEPKCHQRLVETSFCRPLGLPQRRYFSTE